MQGMGRRNRVIEVDGGHHVERARADARRDAVLAHAGYRVLRLDAALVMRDIEAAVALRSGVGPSAARGALWPRVRR